MTRAIKKLLDEFEALPEPNRSELVAELTRTSVALSASDGSLDAGLVAAADRLLMELDRREQSHDA